MPAVLIDNFIGGKSVPASTGSHLDVFNPATDEVIGKVTVSSAADVDAAVLKAKEVRRDMTCID